MCSSTTLYNEITRAAIYVLVNQLFPCSENDRSLSCNLLLHVNLTLQPSISSLLSTLIIITVVLSVASEWLEAAITSALEAYMDTNQTRGELRE